MSFLSFPFDGRGGVRPLSRSCVNVGRKSPKSIFNKLYAVFQSVMNVKVERLRGVFIDEDGRIVENFYRNLFNWRPFLILVDKKRAAAFPVL